MKLKGTAFLFVLMAFSQVARSKVIRYCYSARDVSDKSFIQWVGVNPGTCIHSYERELTSQVSVFIKYRLGLEAITHIGDAVDDNDLYRSKTIWTDDEEEMNLDF